MKHGKKKNFKGDTEFKPIKPFNGFRTTTISLPPPQTLTLFLIYAIEVTYCHFDTALYVTKNENTQLLGVFKCKRGINLCSYMVQLEVVNKKLNILFFIIIIIYRYMCVCVCTRLRVHVSV